MPNKEAPLLVLGPFKGLDQTTDAHILDPSIGTAASNISWNRRYGAYATSRGRSSPFASNLAHNANRLMVGSLDLTAVGEPTTYFALSNNFAELWKSIGGAAWVQVNPSAAVTLGLTNSSQISGNISYLRIDYINTDQPVRIYEGSTTALPWQTAAPSLACTAADGGGGGNLNGTYQYVYTYVDSTGRESSPSPISGKVTVAAGHQVNLTGITVGPAGNDTTERNIYRTGGVLGAAFFFITTIIDNTTTTFTDTIADTAITGGQLILHRDPPPAAGFSHVVMHKDRAWGFNSFSALSGIGGGAPQQQQSSDLWFSNFQAPWEWDTANGTISVDGFFSGDKSDFGVGLASVGTVLLALKAKSFWIVEGDSPQDPFLPRKIADIGCCSVTSIAQGDGTGYWVSLNGIYSSSGGPPTYISQQIYDFLRQRTIADLQATVGWYQDHSYFVSFPNQGITYVYDVQAQNWNTKPWGTTCAGYDINPFLPGISTAVQGTAIVQDSSTTGLVDLVGGAESDLGGNLSASFTSKIENNDAPWITKRYRSVSVTAPIQTATATVTITANPGAPSQQQTILTVDLSKGPTQKFSLPPNMLGAEVQVQISTATQAFVTIDRVSVNGWQEREMISVG